jgi:hypothetical protein
VIIISENCLQLTKQAMLWSIISAIAEIEPTYESSQIPLGREFRGFSIHDNQLLMM